MLMLKLERQDVLMVAGVLQYRIGRTIGLRVKDHYIQQKALKLFKELHTDVHAGEEFKASTGWLSNFTNRKRLVSRRQTSC
jgi:Tc5 transposase DNA-binding domain